MTPGRRRASRFALVGLLGFVVQLVLLRAFVDYGHLHYLAATALAVEAAILHNFVWHWRWTWRDRPAGAIRWWARLARFNGVTAVASIAGNVGLMALLVEVLRLPLVPANALAVVVLSAVNFAGADRLVFPRAAGVPLMAAGAMLLALAPRPAQSADLTQETWAAWRKQVAATEARIDQELKGQGAFLALDMDGAKAAADARAALRGGAVTVRNLEGADRGGQGLEVPSGTIHHWRGAVFIPGVGVDEVLAAAADPTAHRQEDVLDARVLSRSPNHLRLFLQLQRRVIVTATYNTEHDVSYRMHGPGRASSRSVATRIAEVVNLGESAEHERPPGVDRGFLWGLNSDRRYQAVPGGVIVELESLTLSRGVPWGVGAVVRPLVDQVARESLTRTLVSLRGRFAATP